MNTKEAIKVHIFISCRKLKDVETFSNSDPFVEVYEKRSQGAWVKLGQTEIIWNNLNPDFTKNFTLNYFFEEQTYLLFKVFDANIENGREVRGLQLGEADCTLGEIAGARGQKITKPLTLPDEKRSQGDIIVKLEQILSENNDEVTLAFYGEGLPDLSCWYLLHSFSPFFYLSQLMEDGTYQRVYCSEQGKGTDPKWDPIVKPLADICNADLNRPLLFELHDHYASGKVELLGNFKFNMKEVLENRKKYDLLDTGNNKVGTIGISSANLVRLYSFLEYIVGGCQISLIIAVDFTGSNGHPHSPTSLHYIKEDRYNHYQAALHAVSEILLYYDSDKKVPMYGFGGKINKRVSHCFPLNFNEEHPEMTGLQGIMEGYKTALNHIELSGPTLFSQVIRTAVLMAESASIDQQNQEYFILLILTDGEIHDMKETINWIVRGSKSPLSIVIVGIGNENFDNMIQLDADTKPLINSRGEVMMRDIVQFVPFRNFGYSPVVLTKEVLAEIPREITNFFRIKGIVPGEKALTDTESIRNFFHSGSFILDVPFTGSILDYNSFNFPEMRSDNPCIYEPYNIN